MWKESRPKIEKEKIVLCSSHKKWSCFRPNSKENVYQIWRGQTLSLWSRKRWMKSFWSRTEMELMMMRILDVGEGVEEWKREHRSMQSKNKMKSWIKKKCLEIDSLEPLQKISDIQWGLRNLPLLLCSDEHVSLLFVLKDRFSESYRFSFDRIGEQKDPEKNDQRKDKLSQKGTKQNRLKLLATTISTKVHKKGIISKVLIQSFGY
jgi:hypothetical protein